VERAVLALSAKSVKFQKCETDLVTKAKWHLEANGGFIPILETPDGTMINESAVLMQFACDYSKEGLKLWPHEAAPAGDLAANIKTGKHKLAMIAFDKLMMGPFWGAYMQKFADAEKLDAIKANLPLVEAFFKEHLNGADYIGGAEPMMVDIHCFVMVERLCYLENSVWHEGWSKLDVKTTCPTVCAFVERMSKHPALASHVVVPQAFHDQIKL